MCRTVEACRLTGICKNRPIISDGSSHNTGKDQKKNLQDLFNILFSVRINLWSYILAWATPVFIHSLLRCVSEPSTAPFPLLFPPCARISAEPFEDFTAVSLKSEKTSLLNARETAKWYDTDMTDMIIMVYFLRFHTYLFICVSFRQHLTKLQSWDMTEKLSLKWTWHEQTCHMSLFPPAGSSSFPSAPLEPTGLSNGSLAVTLGGLAGSIWRR